MRPSWPAAPTTASALRTSCRCRPEPAGTRTTAIPIPTSAPSSGSWTAAARGTPSPRAVSGNASRGHSIATTAPTPRCSDSFCVGPRAARCLTICGRSCGNRWAWRRTASGTWTCPAPRRPREASTLCFATTPGLGNATSMAAPGTVSRSYPAPGSTHRSRRTPPTCGPDRGPTPPCRWATAISGGCRTTAALLRRQALLPPVRLGGPDRPHRHRQDLRVPSVRIQPGAGILPRR